MDLHDVAAMIAGPEPKVRLRQAAVAAVAADGTISVAIAGSSAVVSGVRCLAHVCPIAGKGVWLATDGLDLLAIGTRSPAGPAYCNITRTTDGTLVTGTWYELSFASNTRDDPYGMWSSGAPDRLTCLVPGVYDIKGAVAYDNNTTGRRDVGIRVNGALAAYDCRDAVDSVNTHCTIATTCKLTSGDYVQLAARQSSGGNLSVVASGDYGIRLSALWLRPPT
jgi:hypothetical protein